VISVIARRSLIFGRGQAAWSTEKTQSVQLSSSNGEGHVQIFKRMMADVVDQER
jgi:hypothetical protein